MEKLIARSRRRPCSALQQGYVVGATPHGLGLPAGLSRSCACLAFERRRAPASLWQQGDRGASGDPHDLLSPSADACMPAGKNAVIMLGVMASGAPHQWPGFTRHRIGSALVWARTQAPRDRVNSAGLDEGQLGLSSSTSLRPSGKAPTWHDREGYMAP